MKTPPKPISRPKTTIMVGFTPFGRSGPRKDEIAILKLVGATEAFVRVPFLISGVVQGAVGGVLAIAALYFAHASLAAVVRVALSGALGAFAWTALPWSASLAIVGGGALLGLLGAFLSVGRYSRA